MPSELSTDTAARLRAIVQPKKGRPSPLAILTDAQLFQVAHWLQANKANEFIARMILDLWGCCEDIEWSELVKAITAARQKILQLGEGFRDVSSLLFDPLAENASLVKKLQEQFDFWNNAAQEPGAPKETLDQAARIGRLLAETIKDHAVIAQKLNRVSDEPADRKTAGSLINRGYMQLVFNKLDGEEMPDYLEAVIAKLEKAPAKRPLGRPVKKLTQEDEA